MSTPPRGGSKTAAKRRAAARRRTRQIGKHLFAYFAILLLVIGTVSTVVLGNVGVANAPAVDATVPALDTTSNPTAAAGMQVLVTNGDKAGATGNWTQAVGYYQAYLSQNPGDGEVRFKLGKAFVNSSPPNYAQAATQLQQAVAASPNASYASEAQNLLTLIKNKTTPLAGGTITGTNVLSGTTIVTGTERTTTPTLVLSTALTATVALTNITPPAATQPVTIPGSPTP